MNGIMNIREINPIEDRVLIELESAAKTHSGLLYVPDQAQNRGTHATVLRIGPGKVSQHTLKLMPMSVKPGDKILIGKYTGWELEGEDKHLRMMRNDEILAIIEEENHKMSSFSKGDIVPGTSPPLIINHQENILGYNG